MLTFTTTVVAVKYLIMTAVMMMILECLKDSLFSVSL